MRFFAESTRSRKRLISGRLFNTSANVVALVPPEPWAILSPIGLLKGLTGMEGQPHAQIDASEWHVRGAFCHFICSGFSQHFYFVRPRP